MLFMMEADRGHEIVAYLAPDDPTMPARLRVIDADAVLWEGSSNELRPAFVAAGRHRTGQCGFRIGRAEVPDLADRPDVMLADPVSDLTIYRRAGTLPRLARKLLRLETSLVPMTPFDLATERLFQAWYANIDRLGLETTIQVFLHPLLDSIYVSGRLLLANYQFHHDHGFAAIVQIRDPYIELADRIAILSGARGPLGMHLGDRDRMVFGPAIEAFGDLDVADETALRRRLRRLDRRTAAVLSNPLARQLTVSRPDELCGGDAAAAALRALAGFHIVAVEETGDWFQRAAADLLGVEHLPGRSTSHEGETAAIASALVEIPLIEALIEIDLEVHDAVATLFDTMGEDG